MRIIDSDTGYSSICLACSVFRRELERLRERGSFPFACRFFDSMLHMDPERLAVTLFPVVQQEWARGRRVLVLYGDCHPHMVDLTSRERIVRVAGVNCCELVLGRERYLALQRQRTFFFMPEWTVRWREIFWLHLGFDTGETLALFMQDFFTQIVYLDTGSMPVPDQSLREIREVTGMPVERVEVGLDNLEHALAAAIRRLEEG